MNNRVLAIVACVLAGIVASTAKATPLGVALEDSPSVSSAFIEVAYSASTDEFRASGFALSLVDQGLWTPIFPEPFGSFNISATVDEFGTASSGSLSITGSVLGFGPTLLTGTLRDFGFLDVGGDLFEFIFTIDDGALGTPELFGGPGSVIGVILDANGSDFNGSFTSDFTNIIGRHGHGHKRGHKRGRKHGHKHGHKLDHGTVDGFGVARIAPIPEPATLVLLLTGALAWRRGWRA